MLIIVTPSIYCVEKGLKLKKQLSTNKITYMREDCSTPTDEINPLRSTKVSSKDMGREKSVNKVATHLNKGR
jgi:hypothetical protein